MEHSIITEIPVSKITAITHRERNEYSIFFFRKE
jgi:hypothetical protein